MGSLRSDIEDVFVNASGITPDEKLRGWVLMKTAR